MCVTLGLFNHVFVQITMSLNNMWGIIHMIVELFMKHPDGKYVLMKVSLTVDVCMFVVRRCVD